MITVPAPEHPAPSGYRWCPACAGEGEQRYCDYSLNPRSGTWGLDPQCDFTDTCRACMGDGVVRIVGAVMDRPHTVRDMGMTRTAAAGRTPDPSPRGAAGRTPSHRANTKQRPRPVRAGGGA